MAILVRIAVDAVAVAGPITLGVLGAVWRKQVADMASLIWTKEATFFVGIAAATLAANLYNVAARRVSEHGTRASIRLERRVRALGETLPLDSCAPDAAIRMILQSIAQAADGAWPNLSSWPSRYFFCSSTDWCSVSIMLRNFEGPTMNKTKTHPEGRSCERSLDAEIAEAWKRASEQAEQPRYATIERGPGHVRIVPRVDSPAQK